MTQSDDNKVEVVKTAQAPNPAANNQFLRGQLQELLNVHSQENGSDTPDFVLAKYLLDCLDAFDRAVRRREEWYGKGTIR